MAGLYAPNAVAVAARSSLLNFPNDDVSGLMNALYSGGGAANRYQPEEADDPVGPDGSVALPAAAMAAEIVIGIVPFYCLG